MKTCGECEYWDKDYTGLCSDIFKPCTHPNKPRNIGNKSETKYSENKECEIEKINKLQNEYNKNNVKNGD